MTWPHSLLYWYAVQELTNKICYLSDYFLLRKLMWNLREQSWVGLDGLWGINIKGENWNIVSGLSTKINVVTKKSIRKLTFYKYSFIICFSINCWLYNDGENSKHQSILLNDFSYQFFTRIIIYPNQVVLALVDSYL